MTEKSGKIWLIGGTGDSVNIASAIASHQFSCIVTVTTLTAQNLYPIIPQITVKVGKLEAAEIKQLCYQESIQGIIDASHPFAVNISQKVLEFSQQESIPYLRYERPSLNPNPNIIELESFEALIKGNYLLNKRVLLTIGCQALHLFKQWHDQAVLSARILPKIDSLDMALKAGFSNDRLIALRPPITLELERALWQQWDINLVVTKASGKQGGEDIKARVAEELGIPLIVIKRPKLNYPQQTEQLSDIIEFCYQYC
ncbi:cobalt-precorrin-6A reductase [Crocosphaera sp. XPORK-15E]|uniref:cobalt-precorrin-6A reductase n=1 Tax=Crocosphaera sp. XPORK-15E TaxID=3110247 RepID=UPI002B1FD0EA|nr:cobalt-precorrin-6A reductase [Crocosphaera sp. XPORK-15E]MEA5535411.1 cobalt-precorrin-6A reductase [Crocosphaera sp. XPORK-15E]